MYGDIDCQNEFIITYQDVYNAKTHLKPGKHDGHSGISSDPIINACNELFVHIAFLLTASATHGSISDDLAISTVIPIPKGKNLNYTDSSNYRGITLSSIIGKIFDLVILDRYSDLLITSDAQFGFKRGSSTAMCSMVLKETLEYYRNNGSTVYCVMLDATKAFDRVDYCKLFLQLKARNLPPIIIRFLMNLYTCQVARVAWNGAYSRDFHVDNGVKQGGVLSPVLFCIYMDSLLSKLKEAKHGCFIGDLYVGALAYADDLVLLAPSACAMRHMLSVCDQYSVEFAVLFNASKSKCLVCLPCGKSSLSGDISKPSFFINGNLIEVVNQWPHLGHIITDKCDDDADIESRKLSTIGQINYVLCTFGKLDCIVKTKLLLSYCSSFYGSELWSLTNSRIDELGVVWRQAIRRVWNVPRDTRSALVTGLSASLPLFDIFCKRSMGFADSCLRSKSSLVSFVVRHGVFYSRMFSGVGRNVQFCCERYGIPLSSFVDGYFSSKVIDKHYADSVSADVRALNLLLYELLMARDNIFSIECLDYDDIKSAIEYVCTFNC